MTCHVSNQIAEHADAMGREHDREVAADQHFDDCAADYLTEAVWNVDKAQEVAQWLRTGKIEESVIDAIRMEIYRLAYLKMDRRDDD